MYELWLALVFKGNAKERMARHQAQGLRFLSMLLFLVTWVLYLVAFLV
jgi:hypothetical protein